MRNGNWKYIALLLMPAISHAQRPGSGFHPTIPRTWDDEQIASLELPLANPVGSPKHVSADYYYRIPVRPIYKQYRRLSARRRPAGYFEWLRQQEPEMIWGEDKDGQKHAPPLKTEADWIKAGEIVFDAVLGYFPLERIKDSARHGGIHHEDGASHWRKASMLPFVEFRHRERRGRSRLALGPAENATPA